jgi:integrase
MDKLNEYLDYKQTYWSETTMKSEESRLKKILATRASTPDDLYNALVKTAKTPYSVKTAFIRYIDYLGWMGAPSLQAYKDFFQKQYRFFKNAYNPSLPTRSYEQVLADIESLRCVETKKLAKYLLATGLRISEVNKVSATGQVKGKGQKSRMCLLPAELFNVPLQKFRRELRKINLTPHQLRKLFFTRLSRSNKLSVFDLAKLAGWSSITTAQKYVAARADDELKNLVKGELNVREI